ncbi:MAG TPA: MaoC/PaaZ C-terminal domain-containing protein [Pseudolysinimonas sp.]|jgi:acyl dehydratase
MPHELKPVLFENIVVGERFDDVIVTLDDQYVKSHAFATDDYHPWHMTGEGSPAGRIVPSTALLNDLLRLLNTLYDPHHDRGLHQREEFWIASPARLGETARLSGGITDTYTRRSRNYFVAEAEARAESDGRLLIRHFAIEAAEVGDPSRLGSGLTESTTTARRISGDYPADRRPVAPITAGVTVGTPLPVLVKRVHQSQIAVYSNIAEHWHTTHTDRRVALEEGLPDTIAQGLMEASYIGELALTAFGEPWLQSGHAELAFVGPMFPGMTVEVRGVVSDSAPRGGGAWVEIEVWVADAANGAQLCVGWVDAVIPRDQNRSPA